MVRFELGTSIPIKDFPGIGASILTSPVGEARANARFPWRLEIFAILVTDLGLTAYCVTDDPTLTFSMSISTSTPKDSKVSFMIFILLSTSDLSQVLAGGSASNVSGG